MPGTPVSPLRSTATVMNYANPLVFVQSTMTQGCKQLTPGIKKATSLPQSKRDNADCWLLLRYSTWQVKYKQCHWRGLWRRGNEMWSSSRALPTASVMPHVEWRVSQTDHTHTYWYNRHMHERTHTHTHTIECLSSAVSWSALKCFSSAGRALSFNLIVWHLLHGQLNYMTLLEADRNTRPIHKHTLNLQKYSVNRYLW